MHENRSLVDLAVLISIWVLALQYFVNDFGKGMLYSFFTEKRDKTQEEAKNAVACVIRITQVIVVIVLTVAAVMGTVGWFNP